MILKIIIFPKNKAHVTEDMRIIIEYSAINKKAKGPPEYSVLKPETNSLSPSEKSIGERLASAKITTNQHNINIGKIKAVQTVVFAIFIIQKDF